MIFICCLFGLDLQVMWWDARSLSGPTDRLEVVEGGGAEVLQAPTCLEYEMTVPARFMVGTQQGNVFSCNRKAKNKRVEKVSFSLIGLYWTDLWTGQVYRAQYGSVVGLQRNPAINKVGRACCTCRPSLHCLYRSS